MQVYLRKDIPGVGMAGEIIKVSQGYAKNYIIPRNLGVEVNKANEKFYAQKAKTLENRKEAVATETSLLAEKIKNTPITIKRKVHDKTKLYNAVSPQEIVDLLQEKGIKISKSQVKLKKQIKETGSYTVTIKLSSRLQPELTLKVIA